MKKKISIIGVGSWGTALAVVLGKKGHDVAVWDIDAELLARINENRENKRYLPGILLGDSIRVVSDISDLVYAADMVVFAVPAQHFRTAAQTVSLHIKSDIPIVNVAKGIEQKTLKTISQISSEILSGNPFAVLSGPSHAEEVGQGMPSTLVAAAEDLALAEYVQDVFMTSRFRVYTNTDVLGVELGGALKNVIALGAGISDGLGFGDNAKAAMMTRGMVEIARLGEKMGGKRETFFGLSGIGDLIVTCTSEHSRNRRCGIMIGQGAKPEEAAAKVGMVVEGIHTAAAACDLAQRVQAEMPITEQVYRIIKGGVNAEEAVTALMERQKRHETESLLYGAPLSI